MKAFFISLLLFILLIGGIVGNAVYVHRVTDRLLQSLDAISFSSSEAEWDELEDYWDRHRAFVALSISYRELDHFSESLIALRAARDADSSFDFEIYHAIAVDAAREIARLERFSLENLF